MSAEKIVKDLKALGAISKGGAFTSKGAKLMNYPQMGMGYKTMKGDKLMMGKGVFGSIFRGIKSVGDFTVGAAKKLLALGKSAGITPSGLALAAGRPGIAAGLKLVGQGQSGKGLKSSEKWQNNPTSNISDGRPVF